MIRVSSSAVKAALSKSGFIPDDFDIVQEQEGESVTKLQITYRSDPSFTLKATIDRSKLIAPPQVVTRETAAIKIVTTPGSVFFTESLIASDGATFLAFLGQWVTRVDEELAGRPAARETRRMQDEIEEITSRFSEKLDGYFTREESLELEKKLDGLEARLGEVIAAKAETEAQAQKEKEELHRSLEYLKSRLEVLDKKGWTRALLGLFGRLVKDPSNRELLKTGAEVVKTILLPPGK